MSLTAIWAKGTKSFPYAIPEKPSIIVGADYAVGLTFHNYIESTDPAEYNFIDDTPMVNMVDTATIEDAYLAVVARDIVYLTDNSKLVFDRWVRYDRWDDLSRNAIFTLRTIFIPKNSDHFIWIAYYITPGGPLEINIHEKIDEWGKKFSKFKDLEPPPPPPPDPPDTNPRRKSN